MAEKEGRHPPDLEIGRDAVAVARAALRHDEATIFEIIGGYNFARASQLILSLAGVATLLGEELTRVGGSPEEFLERLALGLASQEDRDA